MSKESICFYHRCHSIEEDILKVIKEQVKGYVKKKVWSPGHR